MAGIELNDDKGWLNELIGERSYSAGTTANPSAKVPSLEELSRAVEQAMAPVTIYIWRGGDPLVPFIIGHSPVLKCSDLVEEEAGYLIAGLGVVAGKKVYEYLRLVGVVLKWSDHFIPLEDQRWYNVMKGEE
jgi:hypothetical protein